MDAGTRAKLFALIDGCRERGVLRLKLHDGTEFALDPTHGYGLHAQETSRAPGLFAPDLLQHAPEEASVPVSERRDDIAAELDGVLFGKSLE